MPRALDPLQTFPIWLESDGDKPIAERPTFMARVLTGRQQRDLLALSDRLQLNDFTTNVELFDVVFASLAIGIVEMKNVGDATDLEDVLQLNEAVELLTAVRSGASMSSSDLGNSDLPCSSDSGACAASAQGAAATPQPCPNRSTSSAPCAGEKGVEHATTAA